MRKNASAPDPELFERHRRRLMALAYRFLGSVSDAEDIVQETYLRWSKSDRPAVENPEAFLVRIASRLCLDHLRSARVKRETYVGTWLPEPVVEGLDGHVTPATATRLADDVSMALLLALERLTPLERAAFLLHDIFGLEFEEVARAIDRSPAACRQLAGRARQHLRSERPRFSVPPSERDRFVSAFQGAVQEGNLAGLARLLAPDAVLYSDSGGKVPAARRPILGAARILRLIGGVGRRRGPPQWIRPAQVNGEPGLVILDTAGVLQTVALESRDGAITAIYLVRNPDKLAHIRRSLPAP